MGCLTGFLVMGGRLSALAGYVTMESGVVAIDTRNSGSCAESNVIAVETRSDFDFWCESFNLLGVDKLTFSNPAGDGLSNLVKYAFNLSPVLSDVRSLSDGGAIGLPFVDLFVLDGQSFLRLHSVRRKGILGLTYVAEFSGNMNDWTEIAQPSDVTGFGVAWETVTYLAPTALFHYARIRVNWAPP